MNKSDLVYKEPGVRDTGTGAGGMCQVVLYNDNVNDMCHVIDSLMEIFGHNSSLAEKITFEAHQRGRAVAEVEEHEKAIAHKAMLNSRRLTAEVEKI